MHINPATFRYPDRWDASPEEDERFIGLSKIMTAICDALEMTEGRDAALRHYVETEPWDYPLVRPVALAEAMEDAAAWIRQLTDQTR